FNSPMAYIIIIAFLLVNGWFFGSNLFLVNQSTLRPYFATVPLLLIFFVPAFSMRLLAEEKKQGTLELMVTMPISDIEIVLGKFLGAVIFYAATLALTLFYPITVASLGDLDWGPVIGGYLGIFLTGASLVAIGLFASSLTNNQIIAFIISFVIGFGLFLIGKMLAFSSGGLLRLLDFIGFDTHFNNISKGIIDSRDLLYYASLIFLMLFLTLQNLLNRKK
ncbi:MAG TPA: ABC transporter, partial [Candidatus Wirthbacteria bacterium]|nr:ABC transporter [Candidatus Wirthbacteria bacterium]